MLTKFARRTLPVLAVVALAAGCTGDDPASSSDSAAAPAESAEQVAVGSFEITPAEYWSVQAGDAGVTEVRVGGCPEGEACPSFEILEGDALEGVDVSTPYVPEGATCPGGDDLTAVATESVESQDATIAGDPGTLMLVQLSCVNDAGEEQLQAEQRQWYTEDGSVLVVDRWAFEGLSERLAGAVWAEA